jgi:hypothetical protein
MKTHLFNIQKQGATFEHISSCGMIGLSNQDASVNLLTPASWTKERVAVPL